ncbi:MAG: hypothetical protein AVDCRST_MAG49-378 [uncultured Thermomicrobiales bacterium]|uniref:DUF3352 domain-containing protein n=1 Tax=uncultured Thermomicrobiales bacterium TaxID=1645740 RepID=A0A6J4TZV9_9BACT|nr:MAG: hypothetical protein AVDCRST_MAG49-378 [uncultured Thermomicrobiales bacterium]
MHRPRRLTPSLRTGSAGQHRLVPGVLVLLLVSLLAAGSAVGARPAATTAQTDALATASVTPEDALAYASLNLDTDSPQFTQAQELADRAGLLGAFEAAGGTESLTEDEDTDAIEPFLGGEAALVVTSLVSLENADVSAEAVAAVATGDATPAPIATPSPDPTAGQTGAAIVVRAGDPAAAFAEAQQRNADQAAEVGGEVVETDYNGTTIESAPGSEDGETGPTSIALVDDFLLIGAYAADLEPFIDTSAGTRPPLSEADAFVAAQGELSADFLLFAYTNGPAIRAALEEGAGSDEVDALTAQNLDMLNATFGLVVWADSPGFRIDSIAIAAEGAELPTPENFDTTFDERVPEDTLAFANGSDLGAMPGIDALALLLAQYVNGEEPGSPAPEGTDPETYAEQQFERAAEVLGADVRTGLFDLLTGEYGMAISVPNIAALTDPTSIFAIVASGVSDSATAAETVGALAQFGADAVAGATGATPEAEGAEGDEEATTEFTTREVDGSTIYVAEDTSTGFPIRAEAGVVGDELLLGLGDSIDAYLAGFDGSLADSPRYQEVMATLPAEHGASSYLDLVQTIALAQTLFALTEGATGDAATVEDADPACAAFDDQAEAQAAYDEDPGQIDLDQDFDGEACEDFFGGGEAEATPAPSFSDLDLSALIAFAQVQYTTDAGVGTSGILYIASEGDATPAATP